MSSWQPQAYLRFGKERTQPSIDLVSRIELAAPARILDVGCGPGNSTAVLRGRWPGAPIPGLDNSPDMIAKARGDYPAGTWVLSDFQEWKPNGTYDLVFANATIHWIPDHERLIPRMFDMLAPGGALAAQVPAIQDSPVHQAARRRSRTEEWRDMLAESEEALTYHSEAFYYEHLSSRSDRVELWHTVYYHVMDRHQDIIDWYSSSGLKAYLSLMPTEADRQRFKEQVMHDCSASYPALWNGKILFPFKRLFMLAYR